MLPHGLLILDATWRYAAKMIKPFEGAASISSIVVSRLIIAQLIPSSTRLPRSRRGLASIEAIYLSYRFGEKQKVY